MEKKRVFHQRAIKRAEKISKILIPYISENQKVLDFGAGNMLISKKLKKKFNLNIVGVDVINDNLTDLPFFIYDGVKIPFADKKFDLTYAIFVFHHTNNAEDLIQECIRVTKKRLIFFEDVYKNKLELLITKFFDFITNKIISPRMDIPYNFKTERKWIEVINQNSRVKNVICKSVRIDWWRPIHHKIFIIDLLNQ